MFKIASVVLLSALFLIAGFHGLQEEARGLSQGAANPLLAEAYFQDELTQSWSPQIEDSAITRLKVEAPAAYWVMPIMRVELLNPGGSGVASEIYSALMEDFPWLAAPATTTAAAWKAPLEARFMNGSIDLLDGVNTPDLQMDIVEFSAAVSRVIRDGSSENIRGHGQPIWQTTFGVYNRVWDIDAPTWADWESQSMEASERERWKHCDPDEGDMDTTELQCSELWKVAALDQAPIDRLRAFVSAGSLSGTAAAHFTPPHAGLAGKAPYDLAAENDLLIIVVQCVVFQSTNGWGELSEDSDVPHFMNLPTNLSVGLTPPITCAVLLGPPSFDSHWENGSAGASYCAGDLVYLRGSNLYGDVTVDVEASNGTIYTLDATIVDPHKVSIEIPGGFPLGPATVLTVENSMGSTDVSSYDWAQIVIIPCLAGFGG